MCAYAHFGGLSLLLDETGELVWVYGCVRWLFLGMSCSFDSLGERISSSMCVKMTILGRCMCHLTHLESRIGELLILPIILLLLYITHLMY